MVSDDRGLYGVGGSTPQHRGLASWLDDQTTSTYQASAFRQQLPASTGPFSRAEPWQLPVPMDDEEYTWLNTSSYNLVPDVIEGISNLEVPPTSFPTQNAERAPQGRSVLVVSDNAAQSQLQSRPAASPSHAAFGGFEPRLASPGFEPRSAPSRALIFHGSPQVTQPPARQARSTRNVQQPLPVPVVRSAPLQPAAPMPQLIVPAVRPVDLDELENPFARRSVLSRVWARNTGVLIGLFGAVLFGRVLLHAMPLEHAVRAKQPGLTVPAARALKSVSAVSVSAAVPEQARAPSPGANPAVAPVQETAPSHATSAKHGRGVRPRIDHTSNARSGRRFRARRGSSTAPRARGRGRTPTPGTNQASSPEGARVRARGTLRINSRPWSQVFIDGRLVGHTPQREIKLAPGSHRVRLVNPEFDMSKTFTLRVAAGQMVTRVETLDD